jgi:hypothetical protein
MATQGPPELKLELQVNQVSREHNLKPPVKWSQAFLTRRMRQHKVMQRRMADRLLEEVIEEVLALPSPKVTERSLFFEEPWKEVRRARIH